MEFTFTHDAKAFAIPADKMQARERLGLPSYAAAFSSSIHPPFPPPSPVAQPSSLLTSANGKHNDDLSSSTSSFPNTTSFPARIDQSSHDASGVTHDIAREEVIGRIEEFICAWIATLSDNDISEPPTFEVRRRTKANTIYYPGERENGDSCQQLPGLKQGDGVVIKKLSEGGRGSARSYAAIFAILAFSHRILLSNQIATSREVWYNYKASHSCFKSQADCDRAVLDAASLLGVARHQLGIVGAAKGLLAGHFRFRVLGSGRAWNECDGGGGDGKGGLGCGGTLIDSCWITDVMEVECLGKHRPRYIVVVEKECVFKRLIGDGLLGQAGGIVLITGKGYPDLATRACVKALVDAFAVPVVGLCDCNPHGIALLLTYKCGSFRMPESQAYRIPLCWLGLRPSQLKRRFDLPDDTFQAFSEGDVSKSSSLIDSPFCQAHLPWREEVETMASEHLKCELEALNTFSGSKGRRDFLSQYVVSALLSGDYLT